MNSRPLFVSVLFLTIAGMLVSGCGRRGALEAPSGESAAYPVWHDAPAQKKAKEDKPFILDKLIQ